MSMTFGEMQIELTYTFGCQPNLCAARYARIAYCGVTFRTRTFAPDACSVDICESIDVSVGSYDCDATIEPAFAPSPFFRPSAMSLPKAESSESTASFAPAEAA